MINNTKTDYTDYALSAGAGYASYKGIKNIGSKIKKPYMEKIIKQFSDLSQAESETFKKATFDGFVQSGLKGKKYYLHNVDSEHIEHYANLICRKYENLPLIKKYRKLQENQKKLTTEQKIELQKKLSKHLENGEFKKFWQGIKDAILNKSKEIDPPKAEKQIIIKPNTKNQLVKMLQDVAEGKNAFCSPITKNLMINLDKLGGASFHEMGHALNASGSKALKALSIGRHITKSLIPVILAIGLLKPKNKDGEEPNGTTDKATTFIKNNAGKLTFAAFIPTLAEEGLASIRGGQIAKKVLDTKNFKKVNKYNFLFWATYLASAIITTSAVTAAIKIRDKMAEKQA